MSICKNCGLHGCDPMQDRLYAHLKTDNAELQERTKVAEAKLARIRVASVEFPLDWRLAAAISAILDEKETP